MDERKKSIRELEDKRREALENLAKLRGSWGETVLSRLNAENPDRFAGELGQYRRSLEALALFRGRILALEEGALRLRDLETALAEKDKTAAEKTGALRELYTGLGESALYGEADFDFETPLKAQADDLAAKINALQEKLDEVEEGKSRGIFAWIGGSAQGALIRSRLAKSRSGLSRIYASAGEQFALERQGEAPTGDMQPLIGALRQDLALLEESRASLRGEWKSLRESLGMEGNSRNPNFVRRIRELEQQTGREQAGLAELYTDFGARLYGLCAGGQAPESSSSGENPWLRMEDADVLERIREALDRIAGYEAGIEKLNASLRIDEKRDAIDKMEKSIFSHRQRIAASENAIAGLEKQIEAANRQIEELLKL